MKVMKLSSISLIAAALAAMAGGATAAPAPHPTGTADHKKAADKSLRASDDAYQMGWHRLANFHQDDAELHREHMKTEQHNADFAERSIKMAQTTLDKVDHHGAAVLCRQAAILLTPQGRHAEARGFHDLANTNNGFINAARQNRDFARATKDAATEVIKELHPKLYEHASRRRTI